MAKQQVKQISKKELRQVTILVRYFIKATKNVVLYVQNDKGEKYYVTLQRNGVHSCNCKATKRCYHIDRCCEVENARIEARLAARQKVVVMPAQEEVRLPVAYRGSHKTMTVKGEDLSSKGNFGSSGFSLMKKVS